MRTNQNRFIIKFVNKSEFDVLRSILKDLTQYLTTAEDTRHRENFSDETPDHDGVSDMSYQGVSSSSSIAMHTSNPFLHNHMNNPLQRISDSDMKEATEPSPSFIQTDNPFNSFQNSEEIPLSSEEWASSQTFFPCEDHPIDMSASNSRSALLGSFDNHGNPNRSASSFHAQDSEPSLHTTPAGNQSFNSRGSTGISPRGETPVWTGTGSSVQARSRVDGSFLNRYLGMYTLEIFGQTLYFVVMENLLPYRNIDEIYDLKVGLMILVNRREAGLIETQENSIRVSWSRASCVTACSDGE